MGIAPESGHVVGGSGCIPFVWSRSIIASSLKWLDEGGDDSFVFEEISPLAIVRKLLGHCKGWR